MATKQTAGNNGFLKAAKKLFNAPTYAKVATLVNQSSVDAAQAWLKSQGLPTEPAAVLAGFEGSKTARNAAKAVQS